MTITVLADHPEHLPFCSEFGLSLLLQSKNQTILFDTGAGNALFSNLKLLNIAPDSLKHVVLSHGHKDHTGGLSGIAPADIWCCEGICAEHYSRHEDGIMHKLTMPENSQTVLNRVSVHKTGTFQEILPGILLTGPIPRISGESCGGDFYHDEECRMPDIIPEEQALLTSDGILVTGCCHAGIINTLLFCRQMHPEIKIREIAGGLHLLHADTARLEQTAAFLNSAGIRQMCLLHCTGSAAAEYLKKKMPGCKICSPLPGETIQWQQD